MTIQDLINRARSNKSFNNTLTTNLKGKHSSATSPNTSIKKTSKLILKRQVTNVSSERSSQMTSIMQQYVDSNKKSMSVNKVDY